MATLILDSGDTRTVQDKDKIVGAGGTGTETIKIQGTPEVTIDANVERVELANNVADYKFAIAGNVVTITKGTTKVAVLTVQDDTNGTKVAFADGSSDLVITGFGAAKLGGTTVSATAAAIVPATINAADKSTVAPSSSDTTAPTVTATAASYAENQAASATVATVTANETSTFAITTGNDKGYFAINASTGAVSLTAAGVAAGAGSNDFETLPNSFTLGIQATDQAGNKSTVTDLVLTVTDKDEIVPTLTSITANGTNVVLAFSESLNTSSIPAGSAFTVLETVGGVTTPKTIATTDPVSVNGSNLTLKLATALANSGNTIKVSYVPPATNAIKDLAGNSAAAVTDFTATLDTTAPTLTSGTTPADNATAIAVGSNIVLPFSENVVAGSGSITVTNESDASDNRVLSVTDSTQVTFSGNTVTLNPTSDLKAGANYNVTMPAGAIKDAIGNNFAGITSSGTLNFSTAGGGSTTSGTFTLTQGADAINPTATDTTKKTGTGNDTINGFLDGGTATFSGSLDSIDGGAGIDTLVAYGLAGANVLTNVTNIEALTIRTGAAVATVDVSTASNFTSLTSTRLTNQGSTAALDFLKIGNVNPTVSLQGATVDSGFSFTAAAVGGGSDTLNVDVDGYKPAGNGVGEVTDGTGVVLTAGIETIKFNAVGSESSFRIFTDDASDGTVGNDTNSYASATTVNVTGTAKITVDNPFTAVKTLDMSQNSGGASIDLTGAVTVLTVTGGSGNDTVTITGTNLDQTAATKDKIDLNGGANDILGLANEGISAAAWTTFVGAANATVSNTEGLRFDTKQVNNANAELTAVDASVFTNGIKDFIFNVTSTTGVNASTNIAITGLATANTFTFGENVTGNTGTTTGDNAVSIAAASAGQTANIILTGATIAGGAQNGGVSGGNAFTFGAGVSSVIITSNTDSASNTNTIDAGSDLAAGITAAFGANPGSFELKGSTNITIRGADGGAASTAANTSAAFANAVTFTANNFSGNATINLSDSATGDIYTGGSGIDNVRGWAGDDSLSGNSNADVLNGDGGKDTLSGGDGDDILITNIFPTADTAASAESLSGGLGTDKFYIANVNAATTTAANITTNAYVVSDFNASGEKLYLSSDGDATPTLSREMLGNTALSDKAWNATTGIVATDNQVINIGTLATVTGKVNVAEDFIDMLAATTAAAGKIASIAESEFIVVFNSARDSQTYVAVVNDVATAGWAIANDNMTLIKLTGVAVADMSAADFALAATGVWGV